MMMLNIVFVLVILFIVYWFWLHKTTKADVKSTAEFIDIIVNNGVYTPSSIQAEMDKPVRLRFTRKTSSPCASTVVFADFNQSLELPLDTPMDIIITPNNIGEFDFTCEMGMYRGKLLVV
jgi:plastocyanin domain-containing protein